MGYGKLDGYRKFSYLSISKVVVRIASMVDKGICVFGWISDCLTSCGNWTFCGLFVLVPTWKNLGCTIFVGSLTIDTLILSETDSVDIGFFFFSLDLYLRSFELGTVWIVLVESTK